jgi:hypothetical protein
MLYMTTMATTSSSKQNKADLKLVRKAVAKMRRYAGWWKTDGNYGAQDIAFCDDALLAIDRIQEQLQMTVPVSQPSLFHTKGE